MLFVRPTRGHGGRYRVKRMYIITQSSTRISDTIIKRPISAIVTWRKLVRRLIYRIQI